MSKKRRQRSKRRREGGAPGGDRSAGAGAAAAGAGGAGAGFGAGASAGGRGAAGADVGPRAGKRRAGHGDVSMNDAGALPEDLVFEDPYEDELESEEEVNPADVGDGAGAGAGGAGAGGAGAGGMDLDDEEDPDSLPTRVWRPGDALPEGTQLEYESEAYNMYHKMTADWPCLSFDVLRDGFGQDRRKFPHTAYVVAGTQADHAAKNSVHVIKVSAMRRTLHDSDSEADSDAEEDADVDFRSFNHQGAVNRVRCMPQAPHIVATWSDTGKVHLFDPRPLMSGIDNKNLPAMRAAIAAGPKQTFEGHASEGYAMDWSPVQPGRLATGDCKSHIYVWDAETGGAKWNVDKVPLSAHSDSVEDLQWSPTEAHVLASCSVDNTVRIWDTRRKRHVKFVAHDDDVNVISWNKNPKVPYLLVSGSDDCSFKVWDLRFVRDGVAEPIAHFKWHTRPIVSVEWHPADETSLVVGSSDNQVTLWDMSTEADTDTNETKDETLEGIPPQLLFVHQGQTDVKEVHYHPQVPDMVISTAADGFNFFIANLSAPATGAAAAAE